MPDDLNRSKLVGFRGCSTGSTCGDYGVSLPAAYDSNVPVQTSAGAEMTTFNRIFTTERLLQIIVILAATIAMKLMA